MDDCSEDDCLKEFFNVSISMNSSDWLLDWILVGLILDSEDVDLDKFCTTCKNANKIDYGNGYYKLDCKLNYQSYILCQIDHNKKKNKKKGEEK